MSRDSRSHFKFECDGVSVEITGTWRFVEQMYRRVMRDIDRARPPEESIQSPKQSPPRDHVVWIIRSSDMMRRIYMADSDDFDRTAIDRAIDPERVGTLYIGKRAFDELLPEVSKREETLWAELTEAGRKKIVGGEDE